MGPKFDPTVAKSVRFMVTGGESSTVPMQKLGPLGVPPKKVVEDIVKTTKGWQGIRIVVKVTVLNRVASVEILPTSSALILKALSGPVRDRKAKKNMEQKHNENISFATILDISRQMRHKTKSNNFEGTVKQILGTARIIGARVDNVSPQEIIERIRNKEEAYIVLDE
ncbi:hypothetical protein A3Q56_02336 [Intoshia linei]|uniref:60S ribosomal protein L12 n=1 Tax=Intoshia linei TaxID=1819745 RepID=A0A177B6S7_9BILA|nr:hypothetical protein A3Q56_02336 [Intoshia linei]